ncbi:MAG: hypothetical protein CVV56_05645 [Tenericutes bacterium HGW-Tenericutes-1]|jgi:hypothetical protein|nr:MAG: hypothetical protein CVV56_05645 [Tenericutes bacterium HGW-Tenericutes-1]
MRRLFIKDFNIIRGIVLSIMTLFAIFTSVLFMIKPVSAATNPINNDTVNNGEFLGDYDWDTVLNPPASAGDYITYSNFRNTYCLAATTPSNCISAASGKYIRIDTAEELYRFSMDVSYEDIYITGNPTEDVKLSDEKIAALLSLHYKLGNNIDYSVMAAQTFVPIGYRFTDADPINPTSYDNVFTGTFDGQGFTISNLYVAGYSYMVTEQVISGNTVYVATSSYYSMFNYNEGTIQNIGLINPTLEMLSVHLDINFTANLVGLNDTTGVVDHVYVIDNRTNVLDAGIRYNVGTTSDEFTAAGIIHTNSGTFTNAYYSSKVVVNGSYINKFIIEPVLYSNTGGTYSQLVYDSTVYLLSVTVGTSTFVIKTPNVYAVGETTSVIKSGTTSTLNDEDDLWYFYASDSYPLLLGLNYSNGVYEISNAIDFLFFARVISFITVANGTTYTNADYVLTDHIDMSEVAAGAFRTATSTFNGSLSGLYPSGTALSQNYYIYNLNITKGIIRSNVYYSGIFSILGASAHIHDINIDSSSISLTDTEAYYSYIYDIGMIAGRNSGGTIENIQTDVSINLGTAAIGETHAGGIVGQSSGIIERISVLGSMTAGTHVFSSGYTIVPRYYIGGVVGSAINNQLRLEEVVNSGTISGFSTSSTPSFSSGYTNFQVKMGGVIGYILNTSTIKHQMLNVSNKGAITILNVSDNTTPDPTIHVGGIFGELTGNAPVLETGGAYLFANLYNEGNITASYTTGIATVRAAGIGINNATEAIEYALLSNNGIFTLNSAPTNTTNTLFRFTGTIFDIGSSSVTLSRVYNHSNRTYTTGYYTNISPLYYSLNNSSTLIRYSANYGDIAYMNSNLSQMTVSNSITISGITSSTNVSFLNVQNHGNIDVVNLNIQSYSLFVSGISKELSANLFMKNSINFGSIHVAKITSTSTLWTTAPANSNSRNIYIGGLVNINKAGDLQSFGLDATLPVATKGILNCINYGNISSSYLDEVDNLYGHIGMANTLASGIATLNAGSIQDSANLANIGITNLTSPSLGYSAQSQNYSYSNTMGTNYTVVTNVGYNSIFTDAYKAGRMVYVNAGVVVSGIAAATINGNGRIYDTANKGDIIGISYAYVRAGGVLGVSLKEELDAIGLTSDLGYSDTPLISSSVLSNGMNYGNISAITNIKSEYTSTAQSVYATGTTNTQNMMWFYRPGSTTRINSYGSPTGYTMSIYEDTVRGSEERPAIFGSAGGVIAYGLAVMRRMLNHGTVSGTDVAGGIIGATYVIGGSSSGTVTTYININTAINYGNVEAIATTNFGNINKYSFDITNITSQFMTGSTRTNHLFPYAAELMRRSPGVKPGFGGIFGRLQRGSNGEMEPVNSDSFKFIVNVNPNVDLIGRIDQVFNWTASNSAYLFSSAKGNYYSARANDTTQVVFTGYYYARAYITNRTLVSGSFKYSYTVRIDNYYEVIGKNATEITYTGTNPLSNFIAGRYAYNTSTPNNTYVYMYIAPITVPWITEDPDATLNDSTEWIYDPSFPMRADETLTEYIYYMPNELLADKFALPEIPLGTPNPSYREYGMYVLSTSAGSSVGLVLPSNINLDYMRSITESSTTSPSLLIDYNNVYTTYLNSIDTELESDFNDLKQTKFNEKSLLIQSDSTYINLAENTGGSDTELINGTINDTLKTVTFNISMEAFAIGQTTASFSVSQALTSAKALIAVRAVDYFNTSPPPTTVQLEALNDLLYPERNNGISTNYPAELTVTLPSRTTTTQLSIGYITVYSEAFVGDDLYANSNYFTDYEILVNFTPSIEYSAGTIGITDVSFNGGGLIAVGNPADVRSNGNVNYNGSIRFYFEDTKNIFTEGFDFRNLISLQYNGVTVNPQYYTITPYPATISLGTGYYSVLISFTSGVLKSGDYTMLYKYFPTSTQYSVLFDKAASTQTTLSGLSYYSSNGSVVIGASTVTSSVNFGYPLSITNATNPVTNTGLAEYLSRTTYSPNFITAGTFTISPFATLTSVTVGTPTYNGSGYKVYTVTYRITAENGTSFVDYVHTITERTVDVVSVLKNDNEVTIGQIDASREDALTTFTFDLGLDQTLNLYNLTEGSYPYIHIAVTSISEPIQGITYGVNDYLEIFMDYTTLPDTYTFTFTIYQTVSTFVTLSTSVDIVKLQGTDSYLKDIKFSELLTGNVYPDISITDANGDDIATAYDPRVYFAGIDYDGAEGTYYIYRVDGKVSNTPFDQYVPYMVDYLPYGATISKGTWNTGTLQWDYGTEVAPGDDISPLIANFSIDPKTGVDGEAMIPYRVRSEDGNTFSYYFITVTDVTYNVTLIFDIYYCTGAGEETCSLASSSAEFADTLFIITVKNYEVKNDSVILIVEPDNLNTNPALFPVFDEISLLNNQMAQFYFTNTINYKYNFGRNMSGFYMFDISLPLDEYLNPLYTYEIKHDVYYLNPGSDYVSGLVGQYYYVGYAEQNRTRRFNIYIRSVTPSTDTPWGLYDFFRSWFDN